ncbi:MAG: hypothetical protein ABI651_19155, partial [Verrucomicrobiota bacterium]
AKENERSNTDSTMRPRVTCTSQPLLGFVAESPWDSAKKYLTRKIQIAPEPGLALKLQLLI